MESYYRIITVTYGHNGRDGVSNHQPHHCLLNRYSRRRSKKTSKLRVTGLCVGNSAVTGEFPAQRTSNAENVSIWWRHRGQKAISISWRDETTHWEVDVNNTHPPILNPSSDMLLHLIWISNMSLYKICQIYHEADDSATVLSSVRTNQIIYSAIHKRNILTKIFCERRHVINGSIRSWNNSLYFLNLGIDK